MFYRICPSCNHEVVYKSKWKLQRAINENDLCRSCGAKKRYSLHERPDVEFIDGKRMFFRICPLCNRKIYHEKLNHKLQQEKNNRGCRQCAIKRQKFIFPNYNKTACSLIDEYGRQHGYNFQHALNGGEVCISNTTYFVDGYDVFSNVVIEVDEHHHKYQSEADVLREQNICNELNCKFIRLSINGTVTSIRDTIGTIS